MFSVPPDFLINQQGLQVQVLFYPETPMYDAISGG
jgi:hypothetical protein